ncbi:MAG: CHAT domain-containing protein [Nostoc sp. ChiQUE01a]|nr:CHAT domain-containing protein [Nostoc sp. ChiQUE01a]
MTQDIHKQLEDNYDLLQNKLLFLQREKIIKADAATRFQLEQEIKEVKRQIQEIKQEIEKQEAKLSTNVKGNSNSSAVTAASTSSPESLVKLTQQQKILILAAVPRGLCLDKEIREIQEAIRRAANRDLFEIGIRTAVRPQDIRRAIAEEQPQIVHFCGHGLEDGSLLLEDDGGNDKPVSPESLAFLFKLHADYVKCVLLNACYSEQPAVAISQYINYVIGMNNPIQDKAAIAFTQGFYDGLGYKNLGNQDSFERAFDEAMVAIQLENLSQGLIPVLKRKL